MRVLFAINYINSSKQISKLYKKNFKESLDFDVTSNKKDTFKLLKENQYDVLIINSSLDGQAILFSEIEYIFNNKLSEKIILIIDNDKKDTDFSQRLYNLGLYNGIYEGDSTNINICELINKDRSSLEAKSYYNASDDVDLLAKDDIELIERTELLILLEKMKNLNSNELVEFLIKLKEIYSDEQIKYLLDNTNLDIRSKLIDKEIYNDLLNVNYDDINGNINTSEYEFNEVNIDSSNNNFIIEDDFSDLDLDNLFTLPTENEVNSKASSNADYLNLDLPNNHTSIKTSKNNTSKEAPNERENYKDQEQNVIEKIVEVEKIVEKVIEIEKVVEVEKVVEKIIEVEKSKFNRIIIGVMGVKKGIGTTYNSISLAKYLSKNYKVAVVELKKDFLDIADAYEINVNNNMFTLENIDYYSTNIDEFYKRILSLDYQYIIIDFGSYNNEIIKDFYRTDIKLMLCGTQVWEDKYLSKFLTEQDVVKRVKYLFNMSKYREDIISNMPGLDVLFIDYFEDISTIKDVYESILNDYEVSYVESVNKKKGFISSIFRRS
ncbi:hypothetical protein ACQPUY_15600 [Clostridium nigeriense]|uniref:hypothetical protein n=1 Tax=Clostridium nigeriense TaxID=1805470 RepID=UPI003D3322C0